MLKKLARMLEGSESAKGRLWVIRKLLDDRGEVGEEQVNDVSPIIPGTDDAANLGSEGEPDTFYQANDDEFTAAKPDQITQPIQDGEGEKAKPDEPAKPAEPVKPPEEKAEPAADGAALQEQINALNEQLQSQQQMAEFYMTQYNEAVGIGPDGRPIQAGNQQDVHGRSVQTQQPLAKPVEPAPLPENILPPGEWESQEDEAAFVDHRIRGEFDNLYQKELRPVMDYHNKAIQEFQNATAMLEYTMSQMPKFQEHQKSYQDMMSAAEKELFVFSPDGQQVTGVKNAALLNYIKAQPNPRKAMLDHVLKANASKNIQKGVKTATERTLRNITKAPAGPTMPKSHGQVPASPDQPPSQTAPPGVVEKYLEEHGLV